MELGRSQVYLASSPSGFKIMSHSVCVHMHICDDQVSIYLNIRIQIKNYVLGHIY